MGVVRVDLYSPIDDVDVRRQLDVLIRHQPACAGGCARPDEAAGGAVIGSVKDRHTANRDGRSSPRRRACWSQVPGRATAAAYSDRLIPSDIRWELVLFAGSLHPAASDSERPAPRATPHRALLPASTVARRRP